MVQRRASGAVWGTRIAPAGLKHGAEHPGVSGPRGIVDRGAAGTGGRSRTRTARGEQLHHRAEPRVHRAVQRGESIGIRSVDGGTAVKKSGGERDIACTDRAVKLLGKGLEAHPGVRTERIYHTICIFVVLIFFLSSE
jgi:hypothetical protein